jgi:hypothetical protein
MSSEGKVPTSIVCPRSSILRPQGTPGIRPSPNAFRSATRHLYPDYIVVVSARTRLSSSIPSHENIVHILVEFQLSMGKDLVATDGYAQIFDVNLVM